MASSPALAQALGTTNPEPDSVYTVDMVRNTAPGKMIKNHSNNWLKLLSNDSLCYKNVFHCTLARTNESLSDVKCHICGAV